MLLRNVRDINSFVSTAQIQLVDAGQELSWLCKTGQTRANMVAAFNGVVLVHLKGQKIHPLYLSFQR